MVLYFLDANCLLCKTLIHRLCFNSAQKAVLCVNEGMGKVVHIKKLKKFNVFFDVIELPLLYNRRNSENISEGDILAYYDNVFAKSKYTLEKFSDICVMSDSWGGHFALYFNLKHLHYTWIQVNEDLNPKPLYVSKAFSEIIIKHKSLTPFAEFAKPCLVKSAAAKVSHDLNKDYQVWDVTECCHSLSVAQLEIIAACYDLNLHDYSNEKLKDSVLILLNSYGYSIRRMIEFKYNLKYLQNVIGFNESIDYGSTPYAKICSVMTRMAMDFYVPEASKYFIKIHPNEKNLSYEDLRYYYGEKALPFTSMPFELVGSLFKLKKIKFPKMLTYAHNVDTIKCNKEFVLGDSYCFTWFYYCSIYVSVLYAKESGIKEIYCSKILTEQLISLAHALDMQDINIQTINFSDIAKLNKINNSIFICNLLDESKKNVVDILKNINYSNAVCLLNADAAEYPFDVEQYFNFAVIEIEKKPNSFRSFNMERKEVVWVYSQNRFYRDLALDFTLKKNLLHSGYEIEVRKHSIADSTNLFRQVACLNSIHHLNKRIAHFEKQISALKNSSNGAAMKQILSSCTDLLDYIQILDAIKEKYLILLAIKDTPGDNIDNDSLSALKELGFKNISKELWRMYVGVIYNGRTIVDEIGAVREESVLYKATNIFSGMNIEMKSCAWRRENKAEIIIDGKDYAVNIRGLNIVVYDLKNNSLIDSVGFDCHTTQMTCKRL